MSTLPRHLFRYGEKPPALHGEPVERFVLASPYGPHPNDDGYDTTTAASVLGAVRAAWETAFHIPYNGKPQSDEIYGLVGFGSLVKGRFHGKSDIDLGILHGPYEAEIDARVEAIEQRMSLDLHRNGHARSLYIEHHEVDPLMDCYRLQRALRVGELGPSARKQSISDGVVALFQLSIGSGKIPRLRSNLLRELARSEGGDRIWQAIASEVIDFEEYRRQGTITLPGTALEAKEYFEHIELERQLRGDGPITHP